MCFTEDRVKFFAIVQCRKQGTTCDCRSVRGGGGGAWVADDAVFALCCNPGTSTITLARCLSVVCGLLPKVTPLISRGRIWWGKCIRHALAHGAKLGPGGRVGVGGK